MKLKDLKKTSEYKYSLCMLGSWNGINSSTGENEFNEDMDHLMKISGIGYYEILNSLEKDDYELRN